MIPAYNGIEIDGSLQEYSTPIQPPEFELFAQQIITHNGDIIKAYKCSGIDTLKYPMYKTWKDLPPIVKGRVQNLLRRTASQTVADRKELMEFLTKVIRDDPSISNRSDRRRLDAMEAVKELCKISGFYSPVEIKNTHEIVVPDAIQRMSNEQLAQIAAQARHEVIDAQYEIAALPQSTPPDGESALRSEAVVVQPATVPVMQGQGVEA